jgi:putative salt-induced outer membrane protein
MHFRGVLLAAGLLASVFPAHAQWKGKGEAGIVFTSGNSETETGNARLEMARELDQWKHAFGVAALRSSNAGALSAERYGAFVQSDYKISDRDSWFGGLRYEQDEFSGFDYQASVTSGYGRRFIDTDATKFSGQAGVGFRRSKNALSGSTDGDAIFAGQLAYEHLLTETTRIIDRFVVEAGSSNTFASNELALQVKMSDRLALSFGVGMRHNTDPPIGLKKTDTLTTLNLVVGF